MRIKLGNGAESLNEAADTFEDVILRFFSSNKSRAYKHVEEVDS